MGKNQTRQGMGKTVTKVAAASGLVAVFGAAAAMGAPAAVADSNGTTSTSTPTGVATQVRKSVTLSGNADGSINSSASAMVTQVSAVGNGQSTVKVPVGADSARNLDGFSSVPIQGQTATFNLNPNGNEEQRIYTKSSDGPLKVKVTATLDGKPINPGEVVNKTGVLAVNYTVVNTETQKQTVTYKDAQGNDVSQEVEVASPIGGTVDIHLPQGFNEITAKGASIGGLGTGETKLSFDLVLFEPLGNRVANFGYQTRIEAGTLPGAVFTFLPIVPLDNSTISSTKEAYEGGAKTGASIYDAGTQIGENLVKVEDGAMKLNEGLAKAADGAAQLAKGLNEQVVPGANKLAAGADTLNAGLSGDFSDGLTQLNAGLAKLQEGVDNLPASVKADPKYQTAIAGLNGLLLYLNGLDDIADAIKAGTANASSFASAITGYCGLITSLGQPVAGAQCATDFGTIRLTLNGAAALQNTIINSGLSGNPSALSITNQLIAGLPALLDSIQAELLGTPSSPGVNALVAGGQQLQDGFNAKVLPGAEKLAAGANKLADGLPTAADGATQIADGLPAAVDGTATLAAGANQLKTEGADKLAASGESAQAGYAEKVAQINALQQIGLAGSNIPYGPATGPNTLTSGVYQLTLAPAAPDSNNTLTWGLAVLGLVVAGGAGALVWRRVH